MKDKKFGFFHNNLIYCCSCQTVTLKTNFGLKKSAKYRKFICSRYGNMEVLKFITEDFDGVPYDNPKPIPDIPSKTGITPLHSAAIGGHLEIYKYLAEKMDNKNPGFKGGMTYGLTPLHSAAARGHLQICQFILGNVSEKKHQ